MEKVITRVIKKFTSTTKSEYSETKNTFEAIVKASYGRRYVLHMESVRFEKGIKACDASSNLYFDTYEELKENMEYHFRLCKDNLFTTEINVVL